MSELLAQYWWLLLIALLVGLLVAWWALARTARARIPTGRKGDVLDEGAERAARNQALMDAPPAAAPTILAPPPETAATANTADAAPASPAQSSESSGEDDDLTRIKGVGPKLSKLLLSLGITRFEQIARWEEADIDRIDAQLGTFEGRIRRDNWVEQAQFLAKGDRAGFEDRFGKV